MGNDNQTSSGDQNQVFDPLSPLQTIRPDLLGFVFHLSWLFLLFYSNAADTNQPFGGMGSTDAIYLSSAIALAVTLCFGALRTKMFMRLCEGKTGVVVAPLVTAIGTLLYCIHLGMPSLALVVLGGILTGMGSGVIAARWASVFGNTTSRIIIANFPTILAAIVAICVSVGYLPHELRLALLVLLPLCSGASWQFARRYQRSQASSVGRKRLEKGRASRPLQYAPLVALVALIGFTVALLPSFEITGANYGLLFYLVAAVLVLGFVGTAIFLADRRGFPALFLAPLLVLVLVLLPFAQLSAKSPADTFYPVGNIAFELLLLFGTVLYAHATDRSPAKTFMIGRTTLALSDLAGALIGERIALAGDTAVMLQLAGVCLFAASELLLLALVVGYLVNNKGALRLPTFAGESGAEVAPASPQPSRPSRDQRLQELADRYELSERERDVFALLAEGRSSTRIQEDLCIASGTVNYHTRNIYQKLDVHSRQEIIDLVNGEEEPA